MTKTTKAQAAAPLCSCGCGQKTRGGTFRMGHDQRLRGFLSRNESLKPIAAKFVASQPKSGEWRKLQAKGVIAAELAVEAQAKREAAKAERAAAKAAAKQAKRAKKQPKRAGRVSRRGSVTLESAQKPAERPAPADANEQ